MEEQDRRTAARLLADCRRGAPRLARLPEAGRPRNERQAYDLQDALHEELIAADQGRIAGYKIGCTTPVMQRFLDIHHPCAGAVFEPTVRPDGARFDHEGFHRVGVECEIAVRLGATLAAAEAPFGRGRTADAVASVMAAVEVVDERFQDFRTVDPYSLIADDFFNAGAVLGEPIEAWRDLDLAAIEGRMTVDGELAGEGCGRDILGHPLEALSWLANHLASRGRELAAGSFVLLGSVVQTRWPERGKKIDVELSGLGDLSLIFE